MWLHPSSLCPDVKRNSFNMNGQKTKVTLKITETNGKQMKKTNYLWIHASADPLQQPTPSKETLFNVEGPLPAVCSDVRQVHVLVTSRHSFKIETQSVPMNLTTSFIQAAKKTVCIHDLDMSCLSKRGLLWAPLHRVCLWTCAQASLSCTKNR